MKCKKCLHFYRMMTVEGGGYNPAPCCHLLEDTGERPDVLFQSCFKSRPRPKKKKPSYPGVKEAEEKRKCTPPDADQPDFIGNAPNYDKFKGWSPEEVLSFLNID